MNNKPDSKVEVKACPWCQQQPIKRTDSYIPDAVACPNGHTAPMRLSEWNNRPIANNGVSLEDIKTIIHNIITREILQWQIGRKELEIAVSNMIRSYLLDNGKKDLAKAIIAKLPTTAINNGVSFDSIVDKLTHLNGDHLIGLELNDIHIIANFITRLPTTAPRGGGEIKHADNCPSVKGAPVCTCEHLRRYS